jgi:hypothetical protein
MIMYVICDINRGVIITSEFSFQVLNCGYLIMMNEVVQYGYAKGLAIPRLKLD